MFKKVKMPIQIKKRSIISHIICLMILTLSIILCGCNNSSSVDEETFEEKYEAAQKKYEKYYHKIVSGQDVLDLIDNWDETDFKMTVEDYEGERFRVSNIDKECSFRSLKDYFQVDNYLIKDFSLIDMDGNGEKEIVLSTSLGPGMTVVIAKISEEYYGSYYSSREMNNLQENGLFIGSGGASNQYFSKLFISKDGFETKIYEEKSGWGEEANWTEEYYEQFMQDNYSNPVEWNVINIMIQ